MFLLIPENETNPPCYDRDLFCERIEHSMAISGITWQDVVDRFSEAGYEISKANLKTYIYQRNASLKLVFHLSKALNASMDFLLGLDITANTLLDGFDKEYSGRRYKQYDGIYYVYFYPTRTNSPEEIIIATMKISGSDGYSVEFEIPVKDGAAKKYQGQLILSKKTYSGFITLYGENGEAVSMALNDPNTFQYKFQFGIAALLSISSADGKRAPTMSRAIISAKRLTGKMVDVVKAQLYMNSKNICISKRNLEKTVEKFFDEYKIGDSGEAIACLESAFKPRLYSSILESYLLNTFKEEYNLDDVQAELLVARLREASTADINNKIPRSLESRLFLIFKDTDMVDDDPDKVVEEDIFGAIV